MIPPLDSGAEGQHDNACRRVFGDRAACIVRVVLPTVAMLLAACASVERPPPDPDAPGGACRQYFASLDVAVQEAGVRDGIGEPALAYPYLRGTRFLNSFHDELSDPAVRTAWLDAAQGLDMEARGLEIRNLDEGVVDELPMPSAAAYPVEAVAHCGDELRALDGLDSDDDAWRAAAQALQVPDEYVTWHRAVGLYPVSRWFIRAGVGAWQRGVRDTFDNARPDGEPAYRYTPSAAKAEPEVASRMLTEAPVDALGWPQLQSAQWQRLFEAYAPVIEVEATGEYNRIGEPTLKDDQPPTVEIESPLVYTEATGTRFAGETLVQLNYTWWFSERPLDHWFDLLGGALDGLTLRLTFDAAGTMLLVETMHNCGCYHQHYPVQGLLVRTNADYAEPPLVLPGPGLPDPGQRLHLRLEDGSHYVQSMAFAMPRGESERYALADYNRLRSLPASHGERRSLFQPDGLVAGSERRERWFFWVSGVPEAGAMRQSHRHATAFVGRRHFDDADLLERIYRRIQSE